MELHLVYDRDTNGSLYTEFGPERGHNELAICSSLIGHLGKVQIQIFEIISKRRV